MPKAKLQLNQFIVRLTFNLFLLGIILFSTIALWQNIKTYQQIKNEYFVLKKQLFEIKEENQRLRRNIQESDDPEWLETEIRNYLGRQRVGETSLLLPITPSPTPTITSTLSPLWQNFLIDKFPFFLQEKKINK